MPLQKQQQEICLDVLPSWTAWNGLLPSTNVTEHVIFSVCKISSFWLRSATAIRKTSSSFLADSSKIAPGKKRKKKEQKSHCTFYLQYPKALIINTKAISYAIKSSLCSLMKSSSLTTEPRSYFTMERISTFWHNLKHKLKISIDSS